MSSRSKTTLATISYSANRKKKQEFSKKVFDALFKYQLEARALIIKRIESKHLSNFSSLKQIYNVQELKEKFAHAQNFFHLKDYYPLDNIKTQPHLSYLIQPDKKPSAVLHDLLYAQEHLTLIEFMAATIISFYYVLLRIFQDFLGEKEGEDLFDSLFNFAESQMLISPHTLFMGDRFRCLSSNGITMPPNPLRYFIIPAENEKIVKGDIKQSSNLTCTHSPLQGLAEPTHMRLDLKKIINFLRAPIASTEKFFTFNRVEKTAIDTLRQQAAYYAKIKNTLWLTPPLTPNQVIAEDNLEKLLKEAHISYEKGYAHYQKNNLDRAKIHFGFALLYQRNIYHLHDRRNEMAKLKSADEQIAIACNNLAAVFIAKDMASDALPLLEEAYEICKNIFGFENRKTKMYQKHLNEAKEIAAQKEEAESIASRPAMAHRAFL
jgi:hypothetical protein